MMNYNNLTFKQYFCISAIVYTSIFILSIFIIPQIFGNIHQNITPDELRISSLNHPIYPTLPIIIFKNVIASFIIIGIGAFGLKLIPLLCVGYNALSIGETIAMLNKPETFAAIYSIIPHSIIELPLIILCGAFGCIFADEIHSSIHGRTFSELIKIKHDIQARNTIRTHLIIPYIKYIIPMILIAALIECTISIYILKSIFNGV